MGFLRRLWDSAFPIMSRDRTRLDRERDAIDDVAEAAEGIEGDAGEIRRDEEEEVFPAYDTETHSTHPLNPIEPFLGRRPDEQESSRRTVRLEIPTRTIIKVVAALVIIWLLLQVFSILLLLLLAVLLCLALMPLVRRLENRGLPPVAAAGAVYAGMLALFAGFLWLVVPPLVSQTQNLIDDAPDYVDNFDRILDRYPTVREQVEQFLGLEEEGGSQESEAGSEESGQQAPPVDAEAVTVGATKVIEFTAGLIGGVANVFFVLVLAFYLLIEGERTWRYFARYMTPTLRYRFHRLGPELTNVVSGYVIGQAIISTTFGVFTFVVLTLLDVPQPLLLSLGSAILDGIPIVGVPLATVIAMAIGLSVSWQTSLIILVAFVVYQQFENYVLLPRVFGNTLQVTSLSILVGVLVGGQLLGILGIILSLPLTAAIPVVERVWREVIPPEIEALEDRGETSGPPEPGEDRPR